MTNDGTSDCCRRKKQTAKSMKSGINSTANMKCIPPPAPPSENAIHSTLQAAGLIFLYGIP